MYPIASSTLVLYVHADAHSSKHSSKHTQSSRVQKTQDSYTNPGLTVCASTVCPYVRLQGWLHAGTM